MNRIALFLLLVLTLPTRAQQPEVLKITTVEKMFTGEIDGKYAITVYLKLDQFSGDHDGIYSVKGWYWYDKKQIKIPLVGICDQDLTLFSFAPASKQKEILELGQESGESLWDALERRKNTTGFDEKFSFSITDNKIAGTWKNNKSELPVMLYGSDLAVCKTNEYLQIPNGKETYSLNLYDLKLYLMDLNFEAIKRSKDSVRVLLHYDFVSRPNHQGMCGAGQEIGYVTLHFDAKMNLLSTEDFRIESCLTDITSETDAKDKSIILRSADNKQERYKIDTANAQIVKLKS